MATIKGKYKGSGLKSKVVNKDGDKKTVHTLSFQIELIEGIDEIDKIVEQSHDGMEIEFRPLTQPMAFAKPYKDDDKDEEA